MPLIVSLWEYLTFGRLMTNAVIHLIYWAGLGVIALGAFGTIGAAVGVAKAGANGRELQLYRVLPGESCIITSSCLLGNVAYPARGVAEHDLTAVVVPRALFTQLIEQHPPFRAVIFNLFGERLADLMQLVEEVGSYTDFPDHTNRSIKYSEQRLIGLHMAALHQVLQYQLQNHNLSMMPADQQ